MKSLKNSIKNIGDRATAKAVAMCTAAIAGARSRRFCVGRKLRPLELADKEVARVCRLAARTDRATTALRAAVQRADSAINSATVSVLAAGAAAAAADSAARSAVLDAESTMAQGEGAAALAVATAACPELASAGRDEYTVAAAPQPPPA